MLQFLAPLVKPVLAAGASWLGNKIANKVTGVPTPQQRSGTEIGADYKGFLDTAYPGTTPWEQLGANSPMGAIQSGENQIKQQVKMQERELLSRTALQQQDLENKSEIADKTNLAHIYGSLGAYSPQAAIGLGNRYLNSMAPMPNYLSGADVAGRKLEYEGKLSEAETQKAEEDKRKKAAEADTLEGELPYVEETAKAQLKMLKLQPWLQSINTGANVVSSINPLGMGLKNLTQLGYQLANRTVYNRGQKPRKYGTDY